MFISKLSPIALFVGLLAASSLAGAASHCKGLSENACASDQRCNWIKGYMRKDGREVSSHCKLRRGDTSRTMSGQTTAQTSK